MSYILKQNCGNYNLVLLGGWNYEEKKPINLELKESKNVDFKDVLIFQEKEIAENYANKINGAFYRNLKVFNI